MRHEVGIFFNLYFYKFRNFNILFGIEFVSYMIYRFIECIGQPVPIRTERIHWFSTNNLTLTEERRCVDICRINIGIYCVTFDFALHPVTTRSNAS